MPDSAAIKLRFQAALAHHQAGNLAEAESGYRQILALAPYHADSLQILGVLCHQRGDSADALALIETAIAREPGIALYYRNASAIAMALGRFDRAAKLCHAWLALEPDQPDAHGELAVALYRAGEIPAAMASFQAQARAEPTAARPMNNIGLLYYEQENWDAAEHALEQALALAPANTALRGEILGNLAGALAVQNRIGEAIWRYRQALTLAPNHAETQYNLSLMLLLSGQYEEGWARHESRWNTKQLAPARREFSQPLWDGRDWGQRTLLIHAEQGFGDTLQFCRYLPALAAQGRVLLEVQAPLIPLLSNLRNLAGIIPRGQPLPDFDLHCPMLSLPGRRGTRPDTIPTSPAYLTADPDRAAHWRDRLAGLPGWRVGLVWAGGRRPDQPACVAIDRRRSIPADFLTPLHAIPGISLISLQKEQAVPAGLGCVDVSADLTDFAETAAVIANLDLVIAVDTAVLHLTGALGRPGWLLNRFDSCWRWSLDRPDCPWYPSLRQFRQPRPGDWASVIRRVARQLAALGSVPPPRPEQAQHGPAMRNFLGIGPLVQRFPEPL